MNTKYQHEACEEIYKEAYDVVTKFYRHSGKKPKLIVGWGTYLSLCIAESKTAIRCDHFSEVLRLNDFRGCELQVDPSYEFRLQPVLNDGTWDVAIEASIAAKKSTNGLI